ncbi:hypothetical protein ACIQFP_12185 [Nocardiopsis alba]|uniref:hypothetical protein n=1 Tax=Nocardiopsis alba TaxID=53437 RepID=UPI003411063F
MPAIRTRRRMLLISTPAVLAVVFFIVGFLLALTYASRKRDIGTSWRRALVTMSIILASLSAFFLFYSAYLGY